LDRIDGNGAARGKITGQPAAINSADTAVYVIGSSAVTPNNREDIDRQQIAADLLDSAGDPVSMHGAKHIEGLEHHQRQRALSNVRVLHLSIGFPTGRMTFFLWESNRGMV
jgi:hypothetical protein